MMNPMNRVRQTQVNGKQVQIYMLPAIEGMRMAQKLAQVVLPSMGAFYQGVATDAINFEAIAVTIVEEVGTLDLSEVAERLLRGMSVNGQEVNFDEYFMANYGELTQVLAYALKENFSSFFEAKGLFDKFLPKVEKLKSEVQQEELQSE